MGELYPAEKITHKVVAYITHGDRLLVFRHTEFPEAGIQVPAGTLRDGESPEVGVLREAHEETGLTDLALVAALGMQDLDVSPYGLTGIHRRHFFHLELRGPAPDIWRHFEMDPSDGSPAPIEFEFYWARMPDGVPPLSGQQDVLLPALYQHLRKGD